MLTSAAAIGYALVGSLFFVLAVLLATSWRGSRAGIYLVIACLISAAWGFVLAWNVVQSSIEPLAIFILEVLRPTSWVVFLAYLVAQVGVSRLVRSAALLVCVSVLVTGLGIWAYDARMPVSIDLGKILFLGGLAIALTGLLLIEQLYRNSPAEARWGLKALVFGIGGMFAYDLFLYSQAVLFNSLDAATWSARGVVNVLFVPAIAIAARRNREWELRIFVSRHVVFYSTTLVAVGAYLLLMSLGGYLLLQFGGSWGALGRIVFFAGAILVLAVLLFSGTLRSKLRVLLSKHFFRNKYDYREEWMRLIDTLAEFEKSSTREVAVKAVAQIVGSPAGVLWISSTSDGKFLVDARYGYDMPVPDLGDDDPLLSFILRDNWLVDLNEWQHDPEIYQDLIVPDWVSALSSVWLFVPLMFGKELLGVMMLTRAPGPPKLNYEDRDLLKTAGNHVAIHLAQARSDRLLTEAQQFEAYNKLTAFLMHDLNNLIAQQSLIVANAEKHKRNPDFVDDAISTIAGSVDRMKNVMTQLRQGRSRSASKTAELKSLVAAAVERCMTRKPRPQLTCSGDETAINVDQEEFVMVVTHLIRNAQDATSDDGNVFVELSADSEAARIIIRDTGSGMSSEFIRNRLFRPFDSTKGSEGMGIGAYQAREFARKHCGELYVESEASRGTCITMMLPLN